MGINVNTSLVIRFYVEKKILWSWLRIGFSDKMSDYQIRTYILPSSHDPISVFPLFMSL